MDFANVIPESTIHAAIIADTFCTDANSNFEIKVGVSNATLGPVVVNSTLATVIKEIEKEVAVVDKNNGFATLKYCLRADLYDDSDSSFSIGAKKVNLELNITYQTESDFAVTNIQTSEFVSSVTTATATRSVGIKVFKDSCESGCEIVDGDASGCFADANKAVIGEVLKLCLDAEDADVDLTGIESAKVDAGNFSSAIVQFLEDGSVGIDNFVTTTSVVNGQVTLETLLVPSYYDALDGGADGSLLVTGTVLLSYIPLSGRRLGRELQDRILFQDDKTFFISIPLENPSEVPEIARDGDGNNDASIGVVTAAITNIFAVSLAGALLWK